VSEDETELSRRLFDQMLASKPVVQSLLNEIETASAAAQRIWFGQRDRRCIYPPTPAPPELQQQVFTDLAVQLVNNLATAAEDDPNSMRAAVVLATVDRLCDVYVRAGFYQLVEFQTELRTDLRSALRKAQERAGMPDAGGCNHIGL
jgi:hypothetical protein